MERSKVAQKREGIVMSNELSGSITWESYSSLFLLNSLKYD